MSRWRKLNYWINPGARRAEERDIQEELEALRQFAEPGELGNLTLAAEDARGQFGRLWLERLGQDMRYALRSMRPSQGLHRPRRCLACARHRREHRDLQLHGSDRVPPAAGPRSAVARRHEMARQGLRAGQVRADVVDGWLVASTRPPARSAASFPYPALAVFQERSDVLSSRVLLLLGQPPGARPRKGRPMPVKGQYVSGGYFAGMGVVPVAGRLIQPQDDNRRRERSRRPQRAVQPATVRHARERGRPDGSHQRQAVHRDRCGPGRVLRRRARRNSRRLHSDAGGLDPRQRTSGKYLDDHFYWIEIMGRLQPGVSLEQAQTLLAPAFQPVRRGHGDNRGAAERSAGPQPPAGRQRPRQSAPAILAANLHPDGDGRI